MKERILIIEDNPQLADSLCYLLEKEGFSVTSCFDGLSALNRMKYEEYDLIITDLLIPFISGLKLIRHIRLNYPLLPVFVISSVMEDKVIEHIRLLGVYDFLQKPFNARDLCADIKKRLMVA